MRIMPREIRNEIEGKGYTKHLVKVMREYTSILRNFDLL